MLKRFGLIAALLAFMLLACAAFGVGHEVGHVGDDYDPDLGEAATLQSGGSVSPLPSNHEYLGKPIALEGTWRITGGFMASGGTDSPSRGYLENRNGATKLLVYNFLDECWEEAPTGGLAEGDFPFSIADNGPHDADPDDHQVTAYFIAVAPYGDESGSGSGGGGCSALGFAPAALLLLAPLFLLRRRG